jgi:acyl-CoA synthetase (AMP-forming)/AMP-acid ligase II
MLTALSDPSTFREVLSRRAAESPRATAFEYLTDGEQASERVSYSELDDAAGRVAATLRQQVGAGATAVLLFPPGLDFLRAFFGCLYARVVPVPTYPPLAFNTAQSLPRLAAVVRDARPRAVLTTRAVSAALVDGILQHLEPGYPLRRIDVEDALRQADRYVDPDVGGDTVALLQYTSGSTSSPRGVVVTHANLIANERAMKIGMQHPDPTVCVSWLPVYHDAGLIGMVLYSLFVGMPCVLMSPLHFIQRPVRWLRAMSRYGASYSGAPNFAYDLCLRKVSAEERAILDLSHWQVGFNGAEPVRANTIRRFAETFAASGLRPDCLRPSYGLAEGTLMVSGGAGGPFTKTVSRSAYEQGFVEAPRGEGDARVLVSSGRPMGDVKVAIVDVESCAPCAPARVGEIWVAGASVSSGYWGRPAETKATFGFRLDGHSDGPFLRTGDLGFVDEGLLYVAGRLKDVVVVRGRKLHPQDIEEAIEAQVPGIRPDSTIAFGIDDADQEAIVVVTSAAASPTPDIQGIIRRIRKVVVEEQQETPGAIVLIRSGTLPKTSSGKRARQACRRAFLNGQLKVVAQWPAPCP